MSRAQAIWRLLTYRPAPGETRSKWQMFRHLVSERYWEWRFGLKTRGIVDPSDIELPHSHEYTPIPYRCFRTMIDSVPRQHRDGAFVDFGCGKGRALFLAHHYGFRRVLGVELSPLLCAVARQNLASLPGIHVVASDAATFPIPADSSVYFFFNPFPIETLSQVLDNIRASHREHPRGASLLFCNSLDILVAARTRPWMLPRDSGMFIADMPWQRYEIAPDAL